MTASDLASDGEDENVLSNVFASDRDRRADPAALEDKAPAAEAPKDAGQEPPKTAEPDKSSSPNVRDEKGRFAPQMPVAAHTAEREKWQEKTATETRLREDAEKRAKEYQDRTEALERRFQENDRRQQAQAPQQPRPQAPDPNVDPFGYQQFALQQLANQQLDMHLNNSETLARMQHGDDKVNEALQAALSAGINREFLKSRNPYGDLMRWFSREQTLKRVGDDPDKYEKSIEERVRASVLEELKTGKLTASGQAAAPPQKFPGSLVDATASGAQGAQPISEEAQLNAMFAHSRPRR